MKGDTVRRILLEWRGLKLYSYPVLLYFGTLLGIYAGTYAAWLHGLTPGRVYLAMLLLFPVGLVGARLLFIISNWHLYRGEPRRIWRQSEGGASVFGGLVLSFLVSLPLLTVLRVPIGGFWDAASVTLLTGMIFTKVGCLLNGCCGGKPTSGPLGLYLPNLHGIWRRRLPTQLLEAGWAALILLGRVGLWSRRPFEGALFLYTVAAYSLGRCWLESTREDVETLGTLSLHRAISVVLVAACLASFVLLWPHQP
jgi:phosphatidylglycerol:prolipoprotein diacylglycerol transferase